MEITCTDGKMRIRKTSLGGWSEEELRTVDHPGQVLREIIDENRTPELPGIPTFTGVRSADLKQSYEKAEAKLNEIEKLLKTGEKMVEKAKHYIREGDIFQVVLSNPMRAKAEGSLFDTYRALRTHNPSPYMFYFSSDDIEIAHAVAYAKKIVPQMDKDEIVVITLFGRGDKDCAAIARYRGEDIHE